MSVRPSASRNARRHARRVSPWPPNLRLTRGIWPMCSVNHPGGFCSSSHSRRARPFSRRWRGTRALRLDQDPRRPRSACARVRPSDSPLARFGPRHRLSRRPSAVRQANVVGTPLLVGLAGAIRSLHGGPLEVRREIGPRIGPRGGGAHRSTNRESPAFSRAFLGSGRQDLNLRPPGPQPERSRLMGSRSTL
jgi:hypothetical protein